jgi:carboxymethylenebutenolidase
MQTHINSGLLTLPKAGKGSAIMLLPAWWGLNDFFITLSQRLTRNGYVVWISDYYGEKSASSIKEAYKFKANLNQKKVFTTLLNTIEYLRKSDFVTRKTISIIGFSMGARFALELSEIKPKSISEVVIFYGTSILDYAKARAAYQGHFAENDEWFAASGVEKLRKILQKRGREVEFYTYKGTQHWFFEGNCKDRYKPKEANLAWKRTMGFLESHQ